VVLLVRQGQSAAIGSAPKERASREQILDDRRIRAAELAARDAASTRPIPIQPLFLDDQQLSTRATRMDKTRRRKGML
jgi:hypothetical protein